MSGGEGEGKEGEEEGRGREGEGGGEGREEGEDAHTQSHIMPH